MRYFERLRQDWIREMLNIFGFIQRVHVVRKFEVSEQQVSADFAKILGDQPELMFYDRGTKRYYANNFYGKEMMALFRRSSMTATVERIHGPAT